MTLNRPASGWNFKGTTTHPGIVLRDEFLVPLHMSRNQLALKIRVPATRIGEIVSGKRAITTDTALRLSRCFGNSPEFWMNLQSHYDLKLARRNLKPEDAKRIKAVRAA